MEAMLALAILAKKNAIVHGINSWQPSRPVQHGLHETSKGTFYVKSIKVSDHKNHGQKKPSKQQSHGVFVLGKARAWP